MDKNGEVGFPHAIYIFGKVLDGEFCVLYSEGRTRGGEGRRGEMERERVCVCVWIREKEKARVRPQINYSKKTTAKKGYLSLHFYCIG